MLPFISLLLVAIIQIQRSEIRKAEQRTEPQIVEEPDPPTAADAPPQSYLTG